MSKYIKLDDLQEFCDHQIAHEITPNDFQRMNHLEIVRCKDCKFMIEDDVFQCGIKAGYFPVDEEWFCADGKPKSTK